MLKLGIHSPLKGKRLYEEAWKTIAVTKRKIYKISNKGIIKTIDYKDNKKVTILKPRKDSKGYYYITINIENKKKNFRVHRLIAENFIPNPYNKPFIDHINNIKTDNRIQNLRWATQKDNMNNELTKKRMSDGRRGKKLSEEHKRKIREGSTTNKRVLCVETGIKYISASEAGRQLHIDASSIIKSCRGRYEKAGGFHWEYI